MPLAHQAGVFDRALKFLLNLQLGRPVRRLNWTMTINPRLDTSPENYNTWGVDRASVTPENVGDKVHLRVELQALWRLPRSNALLFSIRAYLLKMRELVDNPNWARRFHRVLKSLPPELVDYKGITRYHDVTLDWLLNTTTANQLRQAFSSSRGRFVVSMVLPPHKSKLSTQTGVKPDAGKRTQLSPQ